MNMKTISLKNNIYLKIIVQRAMNSIALFLENQRVPCPTFKVRRSSLTYHPKTSNNGRSYRLQNVIDDYRCEGL